MKGLCGYATYWKKIIFHGGKWQMFMPGCFDASLKSGRTVRLLLNHDPERVIGTNKDGCLALFSDDIGLATRARLPDTMHGATARYMAANGLTAASIGISQLKSDTRRIDEKDVLCVSEARLNEVSYIFVKLGAIKESFLVYKDCDFTRAVQRSLLNLMEKMDLRPPSAAA